VSPSRLQKGFFAAAEAVDKRWSWHKLPRPLGVLTLMGLRDQLRAQNLFRTDTERSRGVPQPWNPRYLMTRTLDGSYNDLDAPWMGGAGRRFGRNVPPEYTHPEQPPRLLTPNPRTVSRELLTRDEFIPATTLNVLAAAWIQFEVHDWVFHGVPPFDQPWEMECADDDPWPERPFRIHRTKPDPNPEANGGPVTWVNTETHWWDGSQIYGETEEDAARLRAGELGKVRMDERGYIPPELDALLDYAGVPGSMWVGLAVLHSLFMREHNAICDHLHREYPHLSDDDLYDKGRLVLGALIAKIHTLDWTTAIIAHPTTVYGLRGSWYGLFGKWGNKPIGRRFKNEVLRGIPGSPTNHHGVPYSLTEEFVSVYRMHPLMPDEFTFRSAATDRVLQERTFPELGALELRRRLDELETGDIFYSLGVAHPGAITLHNFPRFLQAFDRPDGVLMDLAATDILRVRERGVPRYNQFRRLMHMKPVTSWSELSANPAWVEQIRGLYGDLEEVDLMIGLFAEPLPAGFGFSDTAFRVFLLMAARRLESDRFFTTDYRPEVYTQAGLDWVDRNDMRTVLLRHFPELEPALRGVANPFAPWRRTAS
jgi:Animal haem peroxidase